ncbi:ankyrin repeat-containing protein [Plakobranchus ocellatus]|uniref:Ankyrin repeat-containing protein n=1 Tax=Plakobranchus ocellatus TaxID=259542 RepID=A0AAV3YT69_9GAST|nr:ankyrin repeat-containing protein [Plakobranchus ocellatus]
MYLIARERQSKTHGHQCALANYQNILHLRMIKRDPSEKLLAALQNEDLPEVERLLNVRQPIMSHHIPRTIFGQSLPKACRAGLESFLLKRIVSPTNLDPKTCQTLLVPAIMTGSIESVEALLKRGADLNLPSSCHRSVLVVAIAFLENPGLMKMVTFLVEKGANVNRTIGDCSPLLFASLKQPDVVPYLLQNGADVNEVGDDLGNTPLTAAVYYYSCRYSTCRCSIKTLLAAGADPNKPNDDGETALHLASDTGIASLLIQAGADFEARNYRGETPFLEAAFTGKTGVINVLKKCGADMAALDNGGDSALHKMMKGRSEPLEETLQLLKFQCNRVNVQGMTPLMLAVQNYRKKVVKILLELGTDPNIVLCKSGEPHTALSIVLDRIDHIYTVFDLACAQELITQNSVISLPRCCSYFFKMISCDQRRLVQLMVTHGMVPLCENTQTMSQMNYFSFVRLHDILGKLSPLAIALEWNKIAIAQYLTENWFLTPADLVGSMELRHLRSVLERQSQVDSLRFMDENLSQPMSLKMLSFVAVSAQLGGVAGREERVSQTPLPNILKDKLLFRRENFPMNFTDYHTIIPVHVQGGEL